LSTKCKKAHQHHFWAVFAHVHKPDKIKCADATKALIKLFILKKLRQLQKQGANTLTIQNYSQSHTPCRFAPHRTQQNHNTYVKSLFFKENSE